MQKPSPFKGHGKKKVNGGMIKKRQMKIQIAMLTTNVRLCLIILNIRATASSFDSILFSFFE